MIKHIDISKLPLDEALLRCRKDLVLNDKDFYLFSFFSLISVLYFIEADSCFKSKVLSLGGVLPEGLAVEALT